MSIECLLNFNKIIKYIYINFNIEFRPNSNLKKKNILYLIITFFFISDRKTFKESCVKLSNF